MAIGGHFVGILVPKFLTENVGIDEHMYHMIALSGGIPAGILFFVGFFLLMQRRFGTPEMSVNTSKMDGLLYVILFGAIASGCLATALNATGILGDFNYRDTISPWFRSLLMLQPDVTLMENVPLVFKCHMLSWMATAIIFPFTRLVHCLSFPFEYFLRSSIIYRKK